MTWVFEQPHYIAILGVATLAVLGFGWMQTGYRALLYGTIGVAVLTVLLLVVERLVQTENEEIEAALEQMAADVQRNDLPDVLRHISAMAPATRAQARAEFPRYNFSRVKVKRNLTVTIDEQQEPRTAVVSFNVVVTGYDRSFRSSFHVPRFVTVTLVREDGEWRFLDTPTSRPITGASTWNRSTVNDGAERRVTIRVRRVGRSPSSFASSLARHPHAACADQPANQAGCLSHSPAARTSGAAHRVRKATCGPARLAAARVSRHRPCADPFPPVDSPVVVRGSTSGSFRRSRVADLAGHTDRHRTQAPAMTVGRREGKGLPRKLSAGERRVPQLKRNRVGTEGELAIRHTAGRDGPTPQRCAYGRHSARLECCSACAGSRFGHNRAGGRCRTDRSASTG